MMHKLTACVFPMHALLLSMDHHELNAQVKRNCIISDAKAWGYFSICGLLMRLRELYLQEHGLMPWDRIEEKEIAEWIQKREQLWQEMESEAPGRLVIGERDFDPFDVNGINGRLAQEGLVYGSGYGIMQKPVFFLARIRSTEELLDYRVIVAGAEFCRDLSASPAMLQGRCIYIRCDILRSILWDRFQNLRGRKFPGALAEMFSAFHITKEEEDSPELFRKIEAMVPVLAKIFILHETGEAFEDDDADAWQGMLQEVGDKTVELYARAAKDLLADMSEKGPLRAIISTRDERLLHAYAGLLDGMRREILPDFMGAYQKFAEGDDWTLLERVRNEGYADAGGLRRAMMQHWEKNRDKAEVLSAIRNFLARRGT